MIVSLCTMVGLLIGAGAPVTSAPIRVDFQTEYRVALPAGSAPGEASIREHAVVWHPGKRKYYLLADVVPLASPHHPNTYDTEIHLWSSGDLAQWKYHGVAIPKGADRGRYDGYGVASPAGAAWFGGRIYVPFSARKTAAFCERSIGLARSGSDPERLPWTKTARPISDRPGEDDDAAVVSIPGDPRLHLYHRRTGPGGYRIAHTCSSTPDDPQSWPAARDATKRPESVRAQELTAAFYWRGAIHLMVIEHLRAGGIRIAHLVSATPGGPFEPADPNRRYLGPRAQPAHTAYCGHITPVLREGRLVACFWTVPQRGRRYGLLGHPISDSPSQ